MSRRSLPKQFLPLVTRRTMLQDTMTRLAGLPGCAAPIVVSNTEHRFIVAEQLKALDIGPALQILEPIGRGTAPAIAIAALRVQASEPDAILLVLPSDHAIADAAAFHQAVLAAARLAGQGLLVTFGVPPSEPNTGYGYIELGEALPGEAQGFRIQRFVEKPDLDTARSYVASGRFLWNSGMFVFSAQRYLEELGRLRPDILAAAQKSLAAAVQDLDFLRLDAASFEACPAESVDRAVMEKTASGAVLRAQMGWSDVGSWAALWEIGKKDAAGNVSRGNAEMHDAKDCYVLADSRLVYALGVKDLMIIETDDAILIGERSRAQDVKDVVQRLERQHHSEHISHTRIYRPWGYFESIDAGERFQVKRIMVKPHQALSLQAHQHRAEHWVVVSGSARVTRGEGVFDLAENESTFIPVGVKHRLENPADQPLYIIEVQSGGYLGEDDIVRFDDRYQRS
ncbi:MAG: mannose-1-phosphate guanylyltransferase/mannose-6-phosphate isomerase [Pseudomonadota bacterium]|nr:mannose-1-phosphate guanylyltransferase/mannose-6-phosphate isomerase [Pseudomonadota bacterium]